MTVTLTVRAMADAEYAIWGAMRTKLWPDCSEAENQADLAAFKSGQGALKIVLLALAGDEPVGFAEIGERSVVDSCGNDPAAYIEGWYVEPEFRARGVGGALVAAAADWARANGYIYLGSDVEVDNVVSQHAHKALGFIESGRVVNYRMRLK